MRKLFILLANLLIIASLWAQSPEKMSYQAVIRDSDDNLITDTQVGMQISIFQGSESGTEVYVETQTPTTNSNGLVSIEIGAGTVEGGDFTAIDWSDGPYFIKTETDPAGGSSYTITGTSQLLSVPYALHAKTADSIVGGVTETDPVFESSPSSDIQSTDISNWNEVHTWGDHSQAGYLETETDPSVPEGTQTGEMQYWDGSEWITVDAGNEGQVLTFSGGVPTWKTQLADGEVENPSTGKVWMDRNLGASQVADSSADPNAYGDLYQWGRGADGHESRTSGTTVTISSSNDPGHGDFITCNSYPYDWRNPQNDNLWQGVSGTNNPCPSGYRLPTSAEWKAERKSWNSNNAAGAFDSPLKLPVAGGRDCLSGSLYGVGYSGLYWSSTVVGEASRRLAFGSSNADVLSSGRGRGYSVRCLKD